MGRFKVLAVLITILFISQLVSAEVHHENYDEAGTDLLALIYYLQSSFEVLNRTLTSVISLDLETSIETSDEFTSMVENAKITLSHIPPEVDSYPPLNLSVELLGSIDYHLSSLVMGLKENLDAISDLETYSFNLWTIPSIRENLTMADSALVFFEEGLVSMKSGRSSLKDDLETFLSFDWTRIDKDLKEVDLGIGSKLTMVQEIIGTIDNLDENRSSVQEVLKELMITPIKDWDRSLKDLLEERNPDGSLTRDNDIISASDRDLSNEMTSILEERMISLGEAENSTFDLRERQVIFLEHISVLEKDPGSSPAERIAGFEICLDSLDGMRKEVGISRDILMDLNEYDNGTISQDLDDLEDLIKVYAARLDRIEIWVPDLQSIIDDMEMILWMNVIKADRDENGSLDNGEVDLLVLDEEVFLQISNIWDILEDARSELTFLPAEYFPEVSSVIPMVEDCLFRIEGFTTSHRDLIVSMKIISDGTTRGLLELQMELFEALASLSRLNNYLTGTIALSGTLVTQGLVLETDWEGPLKDLISLYQDYLLTKRELIDGPIIYLSLDRNTVPYDTSMGYSVIAVDVDPITGAYLPEGREVLLYLDGEGYRTLQLDHGSSSGRIEIERTFSLGHHDLNATMLSGSGSFVWSEASFSVRKLLTNVIADPSVTMIDHKKKGEIHFEVKDELFRVLETNISIENGDLEIDTPSDQTLGPYPLGINILTASFLGSEIFEGSSTDFRIDVIQDPKITIFSDRTLYGKNDTINISISQQRGNGSISVHFDAVSFELGKMAQEEDHSFLLDPSALGNGTFMVKARFTSLEPWTKDGWSNAIYIIIDLSIDSVDEIPGDDDDTPADDDIPIDDDDIPIDDEGDDPFWDPPGPVGPIRKDILQWLLFVLLIATILIVSSYFILKRKRGRTEKTTKRDHFRLPSIYTGLPTRALQAPIPSDQEVKPVVARSIRTIDMEREKLIRYYLEMIESSPEQIGISRSMTPREVSVKLMDSGLDPDLSQRIAKDFEWSIYKLGRPDTDTLERFNGDKGKVKGWFSSLLRRIGIGNEDPPEDGRDP